MRLMAVVMAVCAALAALPAGAQKPKATKQIQCWTDKSGQRMCGDRIPQEYAGEKRDVMKDGRVIDTIDASKSADERDAEKRKAAAAAEQQKAAEYDRALLEMYRSQADIVATRDERISLVDNRIQAATKTASDTDKSLANLRARAAAQQEKEGAVDAALTKQVKQFEKSQKDNAKALDRYNKERDALQAKYDKDYMRFSELRGMPATPPPPPKPFMAQDAATPATPAKPADAKAGTPAKPATPATPAKKG